MCCVKEVLGGNVVFVTFVVDVIIDFGVGNGVMVGPCRLELGDVD